MDTGQLPHSRHFRLEQLADGVYAAIHLGGGAAIGNAGIVDLGDRTLVYDSTFTPQAGADLRRAAEALTGRPVSAVINSHYHNDHMWGNQAFGAETDIVSSAETRRLIVATGGHDDYATFSANAEANLASTQAALQAAEQAAERRQIAMWVDYYRAFVEAKPVLRFRAPNVAFTGRIAWHGAARSAELIDLGRGHSPSDAVLYLPQDRIVFMSDLLFVDHHPLVIEGDPQRFLAILDEVAALEPERLVPGHGPVGGPESLQREAEYIRAADRRAEELVADRRGEDAVDELAVPEAYAGWLLAAFYPLNVRYLYRHKRDAGGAGTRAG
ncbi:MAG: MBL fold metallo-hydrolase [Anaerolineae bacterium]|nr:MBL fold metallo-hydrolase [Anaerolineae bacterium]